ncbi:ABC transporter ATP-binding protein [Sphingobium herbicidovorans NBRC 16415]|uniref:ABC transporter ATP-binding protein n=1 Tax=Sphingobium herbicidovorans (strain ATCC 700291 / DSM 11019 / CCUG 56400 / KCTC 2939 / LMG 18315 / NBRC 16415 / MH) TaxID=1219045 RepID=A0A086PEL1_SPHHM|nr:ABC transporter ATP-binding protein [Sphingobium herbicidovorans]KFG91829.1 ABC transporter ATP-binding protein [Sphingobium herbicidovorans NBRC 16415]
MAEEQFGLRHAAAWVGEIVGPDKGYVHVGIVYTLAITLLSLATPISVQLLINSVARTALVAPLWILSGVLLVLLLLVACLSALRLYLMTMFERRLFARVVAEVTVRAVHAQNPFFADESRGSLFNRYFDMVVVQKSVPSLVIGAFTIILQAAVGLVVTSFYHPFFLAFNIVLVVTCLLIWMLWRHGAITGAVGVSHAKHEAAHWLESVGASNGFYKSARHLNFAMDRSEEVTANYIRAHRRYFRYSFAQALAYFLVYAFAAAALLALGGHLILAGELSIGQLVAAELILSGVFYGIAQLGWYLDTFYDLVASSEELSQVFAIPQEPVDLNGQAPPDGSVRFRNVELAGSRFDFAIDSGEQAVILAGPGVENQIALLLKRHVNPDRGLLTIGGSDLGSFDMYLLRSAVVVLNRPTIVDVTIREYLNMAAGGNADSAITMKVLDIVGLATRIASLPKGLDTQLASSGSPLSIVEVMQLKVASALIGRPKVLFLSQLYDMMPAAPLQATLNMLREQGTTVLLFTARPEALNLDCCFWLGAREQHRFADEAALSQVLAAREAQS